MLYNQHVPNYGGIEVVFTEPEEVETVRAAFISHNAYLRSLGNDSSISEYQQLIAQWQGVEQSYRGPDHDPLVDKLRYLSDTTEEAVDTILGNDGDPERIEKSGRRYELGHRALSLAQSIELHATMDSDWSETGGEAN